MLMMKLSTIVNPTADRWVIHKCDVIMRSIHEAQHFCDVLLRYWLVNMEEALRLRDAAAIIINLRELLICRLTDS